MTKSERIGQIIQEARTRKRLSLRDVYALCGINASALSRLENGRNSDPSIGMLAALSKALDVPLNTLIGEPEIRVSQEASIPESLRVFAESAGLDAVDIQVLAGISYRGRRPQTTRDWWFIHEAIKRSVGTSNSQDQTGEV